MEDVVVIHEWQKITTPDLNNLGQYPRKTFDHILEDLGPGTTYSGFAVTVDTNTSVKVGPGRLYTAAGPMFYNEDEGGTVLDLLGYQPQVTRRYVAIGIWGETKDTSIQPRTFLSDAETRLAVGRDVPTRNTRRANVSLIHTTTEAPDPARPAEPAGTLIIAYVLMDTSGVVSIEPVSTVRAPSLRTHEARLNENDSWRTRTGTRLDTLGSDISGLATRISGAAPLQFVLRMAADLARAKEKLGLPATYAAYGSDHFLVTDQSDTAHVDYLAKVEEGIRFPPAAERDAQFALLNPLDPKVRVDNNFMLPAWNEVPRLSVLYNDGEISISQNQHQTITWRMLQKTRTRIRWGTPFFVCSNGMWWYDANGSNWQTSAATSQQYSGGNDINKDLIYDPIRNILERKSTGETFQILDVQDNPEHTVLRLAQFWVDEIVDSTYWDRVVTTEGLSGSIWGQTVLNTQGGYLTSIDLAFSRVAAVGDVHVLVCETTGGEPNFDRVIARSTVAAADLKVWPALTKFKVPPTYHTKGTRYAYVVQSPGNHFLCVAKNNKFAQGSLFRSTDGSSQQVDIETDMSIQLNFAKFDATRVEVQLLSLELNGGIAAIDMNYDSIRPDQALVQYRVQIGGKWVPISGTDVHPLNGLPPLLPLQVVLTGTTDEMPGIGLGPASRVLTSRPRSDFRHISKSYIPGGTVATVHVDCRLEAWRGAPYHVHTCTLLTGAGYATVRAPTLVSEQPAPDDPGAIIRRYTFTGLNVTGFKIRQEGMTDNVLSNFHVAERVYIALA